MLRRRLPDSARPYKMWLYPVPAIVAFFGWVYMFVTSGWRYVAFGTLTLVVGVVAFLVWARWACSWPFAVLHLQEGVPNPQ